MKPGIDIAKFTKDHGVRFIRKDKWWVTRWIAKLLFFVPGFMTDFWTTIGRTVAYPESGPDCDDGDALWVAAGGANIAAATLRLGAPKAGERAQRIVELAEYLEGHRSVVEHEFHHVIDFERWGVLFAVSYLLLPVPFVFAWFRWRWEREAFLYQIVHYGRHIDDWTDADGNKRLGVVSVLWSSYLCWPRAWMRAWFRKATDAEVSEWGR